MTSIIQSHSWRNVHRTRTPRVPAKLETYSDKTSIIARIKELHLNGAPLNICAVKRSNPGLVEATYDFRPFWGWRQALEEAGIQYSDIRVRLEDEVVCRICGGYYAALAWHLAKKHDITPDDYSIDFPDAEFFSERLRSQWFGVRTSTGKGAGVILPHWEPLWTPEYVLDRMAYLSRKGVRLSASVIQEREPTLAAAATRFFGSWKEPRRLIGLDARRVRWNPQPKWTRDTILAFLRERHQSGLPLNLDAVSRIYSGIPSIAKRIFGSYDDALVTLGLDPGQIRLRAKQKYFTRENVLEGIRQRLQRRLCLSYKAMSGPQGDASLHGMATRLFGSWRRAVESAGIDYDQVREPFRKYPTKKDVLREIKKRRRHGTPLNGLAVLEGRYMDVGLHNGARRFFGSWTDAIKAAGIDFNTVRGKKRRYPTKESVVGEIRRRTGRGWPLTMPCHGPRRDPALGWTAIQLFGSWPKAVRAAGLQPVRPGQSLILFSDGAAVMKELNRRRSKQMSVLANEVVETRRGPGLYNAAIRHFGTWKKALEHTGIPCDIVYAKKVRFPTKESVVAEIRRREERGLPIQAIGKGKYSDYTLAAAGRRMFGGWSKAILAAGLKPLPATLFRKRCREKDNRQGT